MLHLQPIPLSTAFIKGYLGIPRGLPARSEGAARAKLEGSDPEEIRGGGKEPFARFQNSLMSTERAWQRSCGEHGAELR